MTLDTFFDCPDLDIPKWTRKCRNVGCNRQTEKVVCTQCRLEKKRIANKIANARNKDYTRSMREKQTTPIRLSKDAIEKASAALEAITIKKVAATLEYQKKVINSTYKKLKEAGVKPMKFRFANSEQFGIEA